MEPSYLVDGTGEALFDGEIARALSDGTIPEIALGCARLPRREKGIVLGIVRQFEAMGANDRTEPVARSQPTGRPTLGHAIPSGTPTPRVRNYRDPLFRRTARRSPPGTPRRGRSTPRPP